MAVSSIRDAPLRMILQASYDLYSEGEPPTFERVALRLDDPGARALAAGLLLSIEPGPLNEDTKPPAPWAERLAGVLAKLDRRDREDRLREVEAALRETDEVNDPDGYRALRFERFKLLNQRPDTKKADAS